MNQNCPVCGKGGLPNYKETETICPQCNSDLKPFLLLHSLTKPGTNKVNVFALSAPALSLAILAILYFNSVSQRKQIASENFNALKQLRDSMNMVHPLISSTQPIVSSSDTLKKDILIHYKVKKGDCPSRIAQYFYSDWKMYKQIEKDNNFTYPYNLKVGQSIVIKLKPE